MFESLKAGVPPAQQQQPVVVPPARLLIYVEALETDVEMFEVRLPNELPPTCSFILGLGGIRVGEALSSSLRVKAAAVEQQNEQELFKSCCSVSGDGQT
jgi:hypothetical protein